MMDDEFSAWLTNLPAPLPADEQAELMRAYKGGDEEAGRRLVETNLRLVVSCAKSFTKYNSAFPDLVQAGALGLRTALDKFKFGKGAKFATYASLWIRSEMHRQIQHDAGVIKIASSRVGRKVLYKLNYVRRMLYHRGIEPTWEAIGEYMGYDPEDVHKMAALVEMPNPSFDQPVGDDEGGDTLMDLTACPNISPEDAVVQKDHLHKRAAICRMFADTLDDERELDIWHNRMIADDPSVLRELGERWDVSKERIRQVEADLKSRLREYCTSMEPSMFGGETKTGAAA